MSEELIVRHCAPTLANLKTGSLFVCPITDRPSFFSSLRSLNELLVPKGLRALPLRIREYSALVYLYRPSRLKKDLEDPAAIKILQDHGYGCYGKCLPKLIERVRASEEFPHEIGLFLGYPPEDVQGFLDHRPCKCSGCWKVYCDECEARKTFRRFDKCKEMYSLMFQKGKTVCQLTIAA